MKVVFLCGSLDPGCDGVGDYTRSLGAALSERGHRVLCISLNEPGAANALGLPDVDGGFLRLSGSVPWPDRIAQAEQAMRDFAPDWVSLQFVPYGFHPKGLVSALAHRLAPLFANCRSHFMFHELWIGESVEYSLKDRIVGFLQRRAVLRLLREFRPTLVQTSNPVYCEMLRRNGVHARELPLPGNVPVLPAEPGSLEKLLRERGWPANSFVREEWWVAGVFGSIHPRWSPESFLDRLCTSARQQQKRLLLLHLGRTPATGAQAWQELGEVYSGRCEFLSLGALSAARLSVLFQALDFGIATSPWALIGKSGSTAAMLDHGLPVMVTRDDWELRLGVTPPPTPQPLLFRTETTFLKHLEAGGSRQAARSRWPDIAEKFSADLCQPECVPGKSVATSTA